MKDAVLREFANPSCDYRGAPFWGWNGRLENDELRRQIRLMRRMGMGGFFMHSRVGLATPYLSDEWMDRVNTCVEEAGKLGMNAWLYDEDRWPSGAAGGMVTKNPAYRERQLEMLTFDSAEAFRWNDEYLAAFVAKLSAPLATNVRRLIKGERPATLAKGEKVLAFRVKCKDCSSWYNGYTYLDCMNYEGVREFVRITHEAYRRRFGEQFGKRIPGIFTDEPTYGKCPGVNFIQWTDKFPEHFRQRYGYDILDHLVELLFDVDGKRICPVRQHYFDCATFLFTDAFARQIGSWCRQNNMLFTGHVLGEETLAKQTAVVGAAMRFYEHMQAPGMDVLKEYNREYDTAKQVSSIAAQFGRRWRVTETYGCTGWDFSFAGHKAIGDWQAALGINLRCQHLAWYTMQGEAKRDYPACIFYQSPWWQSYTKVEDYFARVNLLMSHGREIRDLLVIHPIESMWVIFKTASEEEKAALDEKTWKFRDALLADKLDFDWGDEDILARHGKVETRDGKAVLAVGAAVYTAVAVPEMLTIRRTTLELLRKFRDAGGTVVFLGQIAGYVDASPSNQAAALARACLRAADHASLVKALESASRRVSITDAAGEQIAPALYCLREDDDAFYLFICNTSHDNFGKEWGDVAVRDRKLAFDDVRVKVFASGVGQPLELDAETGGIYSADGRSTPAGWVIRTSLPALGSRLFVLPKNRSGRRYPRRKKFVDVSRQVLKPARWAIQLSEPNCLVLDKPGYRIGNGRWQKPSEILKVDIAIRTAMGIQNRGKNMVQPWAQARPAEPKKIGFELEYSFEVRNLPTGPIYLAIERPETFTIAVNGVELCSDVECGWWVDNSLRKLTCDPSILKLGTNIVSVRGVYDEFHSGLEIVYLLGSFGTAVKGSTVVMTKAPESLKLGDWVGQGLAFYSGSVSYVQKIRPRLAKGRRLFVQVPAYRGTAVRVLVNGRSAGIIAWEPNELDITDLLVRGENTLTLEVLGHRRNSHGPLHLNYTPRWYGPAEFHPKPNQEIEGYNLVPCGLMKPPVLVVRK